MGAATKQDHSKLINDLRAYREELAEKLAAIDDSLRMLEGRKGPGRPPKTSLQLVEQTSARAKPNWSDTQRREVSERMKKYWAERRKKTKKAKKVKKEPKTTQVFAE